MTKEEEIVKQILTDSDVEKRLKDYFNLMINAVGEDYTSYILSNSSRIKDSLSSFTARFDDVSSLDVMFVLLRAAILSTENKRSNQVVKRLIENGKTNELLHMINSNLSFRRALTKTFMGQCTKTDEQLYGRIRVDNNVIGNLITLKYSEDYLNKHGKKTKVRILKKED